MGTRGAKSGRGGLQGLVVAGELALATILVAGAGLMGRTLSQMNRIDTGIDVQQLAWASFSVSGGRLAPEVEGDDRDEIIRQLYEEVRAQVARLPWVASASLVSTLPLSGSRGNNSITNPERPELDVVAGRRFVSGGYFETTGIRIVEGRGLTEADDRVDAQPVMVLSEAASAALFPEESSIGKTVTYWSRETRVVGVAAPVIDVDLKTPTSLAFYVPRASAGESNGDLVIRARAGQEMALAQVSTQIQAVSQEIAIRGVAPMSDLVRSQLADERYRARLFAVFSGLAALFAVLGIYGVTTRNVASRRREMGIRRALGASGNEVAGIVLTQALRLALLGAVVGIVGTLFLGRLVQGFLWGVEPSDPMTLGLTALALGVASVVAAAVPGRRAARIDPMEALRGD
jgi:putative ABC transport system permease protein